jgi:ATPase subunit of ABC transporter with duplicated ATPase domains
MMGKSASGTKLTGKEKRMLAKAEKEGRLPSLNPEGDGDAKAEKKSPALSLPESWARALEAVSVHVRGGGGDPAEDEGGGSKATGAVVDVHGLDVSIRGVRLFEDAALRLLPGRKYALLGVNGMAAGFSMTLKLRGSTPSELYTLNPTP